MNMKHADAAALERDGTRLQPPPGGGFAGHGKSSVAKSGKPARARSNSIAAGASAGRNDRESHELRFR